MYRITIQNGEVAYLITRLNIKALAKGFITMHQLQILAGAVCSLIFMSATFPMLYKAWRTKNMASYSLLNIGLNNVGNLLYWLYVTTLPIGPVWILHSFNTVVTLLMFIWYLMYRVDKQPIKRLTAELKRQTMSFAPIRSENSTAS
ncbi:MAG: hypothetical protein K8L91_23415 [Anaerolineae bacterium]|nr:hypothetical protein [Anaerolineae bacterium]